MWDFSGLGYAIAALMLVTFVFLILPIILIILSIASKFYKKERSKELNLPYFSFFFSLFASMLLLFFFSKIFYRDFFWDGVRGSTGYGLAFLLPFLLYFFALLIYTYKNSRLASPTKKFLIIGYLVGSILVFSYFSFSLHQEIREYNENQIRIYEGTKLAFETKNPKYCFGIGEKCFYWLAYSSGNYSLCDKVSIYNEECYLLAAIKTNNSSYCEKINLEDADSYTQKRKKEECYFSLATLNKNSSYCSLIEESYRGECFRSLTFLNNDHGICDKINNSYLQKSCKGLNLENPLLSCNKLFSADVCLRYEKEFYMTYDEFSRENPCNLDSSYPHWCDYDYYTYNTRFLQNGYI